MELKWRWDEAEDKITSQRWNGAAIELDETGLNGAEMVLNWRWNGAGIELEPRSQVGSGMELELSSRLLALEWRSLALEPTSRLMALVWAGR